MFEPFTEYLLHYGEPILRQLEDPTRTSRDILELFQKDGMIEQDGEGRWQVAPGGLRKSRIKRPGGPVPDLQPRRRWQARHRPEGLGRRAVGGHPALPVRRPAGQSSTSTRRSRTPSPARPAAADPPQYDDFVVFENEYQACCSTVVLIDMSGLMGRYGKYGTTKKIALALQALVRGQYSQDTIQMVGFYTLASKLTEPRAAELGPQAGRPVRGQPGEPGGLAWTNPAQERRTSSTSPTSTPASAQRGMFARSGSENKQIIIITDGEPTAHIRRTRGRPDLPALGKDRPGHPDRGPPQRPGHPRRASHWIEDYFHHGLVNFVEELARATHGVAAYCSAEDLGKYVFDSFIGGRRQRRMTR
ncbi:MAG: VWA domain-containing protein [Isosphaeraceae bacterium]